MHTKVVYRERMSGLPGNVNRFPPRLPEPPSVLRLQATQVSEVAGACEQTHIGMKFSGQEVLQPKGFECTGYLNQTLMNMKLVDITSTRICSIFAQFQVNCQKVSGCKFQSILSKNLALNLSYLCRNREVQTWYQVIAT